MKVNSAAMHRLIKAMIHKKDLAIPTKEMWPGTSVKNLAGHTKPDERVYLVPIKQIQRSEYGYKTYRHVKGDAWHNAFRKESIRNVNKFRRLIRANKHHLLPPIRLVHYGERHHYEPQAKYMYALSDGHHRLTAHQAEGKRFIRATIEPIEVEGQ